MAPRVCISRAHLWGKGQFPRNFEQIDSKCPVNNVGLAVNKEADPFKSSLSFHVSLFLTGVRNDLWGKRYFTRPSTGARIPYWEGTINLTHCIDRSRHQSFILIRTEKWLISIENLFRETIIPLIIGFLEGVGWEKLISSTALHILHSAKRRWPLGTNYQPRRKNGASVDQSESKMLFESMRKCHIWIPLEILSFVDLKILKIGQEMAKLVISQSSWWSAPTPTPSSAASPTPSSLVSPTPTQTSSCSNLGNLLFVQKS